MTTPSPSTPPPESLFKPDTDENWLYCVEQIKDKSGYKDKKNGAFIAYKLPHHVCHWYIRGKRGKKSKAGAAYFCFYDGKHYIDQVSRVEDLAPNYKHPEITTAQGWAIASKLFQFSHKKIIEEIIPEFLEDSCTHCEGKGTVGEADEKCKECRGTGENLPPPASSDDSNNSDSESSESTTPNKRKAPTNMKPGTKRAQSSAPKRARPSALAHKIPRREPVIAVPSISSIPARLRIQASPPSHVAESPPTPKEEPSDREIPSARQRRQRDRARSPSRSPSPPLSPISSAGSTPPPALPPISLYLLALKESGEDPEFTRDVPSIPKDARERLEAIPRYLEALVTSVREEREWVFVKRCEHCRSKTDQPLCEDCASYLELHGEPRPSVLFRDVEESSEEDVESVVGEMETPRTRRRL